MTTNLRRLFWGCALSMCLSVPAAMAQNVTGSVTGEVTDPSGAVVANAQVVAHNLDTGVDTAATSNADGVYRLDFLQAGHYQVTVTASGFSKTALPAFSLESDHQLHVYREHDFEFSAQWAGLLRGYSLRARRRRYGRHLRPDSN